MRREPDEPSRKEATGSGARSRAPGRETRSSQAYPTGPGVGRSTPASDAAAPATAGAAAPATADNDGWDEMFRMIVGDAANAEDESAVAHTGFQGAPSDLPHRAELESALGVDLAGTRAHLGPDAAAASEQLGADAYAIGDDIAFADSAPSKELVAHEVVHALQQRGGSGGRRAAEGDAAEAEADDVAARVANGERIPAGAVAGGGARTLRKKKSLRAKFKKWARSATTEGDNARLEQSETSTEGELLDDGQIGRSTTTDTTTIDPGTGGLEISRSKTIAEEIVDLPPEEQRAIRADVADDIRREIAAAKKDLVAGKSKALVQQAVMAVQKRTLASKQNELEDLDQDLVAGKLAQVKSAQRAVDKKIAQLKVETEWCNLLSDAFDKAEKELGDGEDKTPSIDTLDRIGKRLDGLGAQYKKKLTVVETSKWKFDVANNAVGGTREKTTTEHFGPHGAKETGTSRSTTASIGSGATVTHSRTESEKLLDADGNVLHGRESTRSAHGKAIAKSDGSRGFGGGAKLGESLENTYGKAFAEGSADGAFTVNIVAIPKANDSDPQTYAVVLSLNLTIGGTLGGETSKKGARGGKATAGVSGSVTASGELIHTHTMTAAEVARYLADLEGTTAKKKKGKEPEFELLHKVRAGLESTDDMAGAIGSALGSGDVASGMEDGESVELTLRVDAGASASVGGGNSDSSKSVGAEGGVKGGLYRTVKIGKTTVGDNKLVEVMVAFGNSQEMSGALSASALGVTARAAGKKWSGAEASAVFRLDPDLDDYNDMYRQVVGTMTPSGLKALRTSPDYIAHVASYTHKQHSGSSSEFSASGPVGIRSTEKHGRESSDTKNADGSRKISEAGTGTHELGLALGPLELLKASRTDKASYEFDAGASILDLGEEDAETGLGFQPSIKNLIEAESLKAGLEKQVTATKKRLSGIALDSSDIELLVTRATNADAWKNVHYRVLGADDDDLILWNGLRTSLVKPTIAAGYSIEELPIAREVARGNAVADFYSAVTATTARNYMRICLREFHLAGGDGTDIGKAYEWPPELAKTKPKFEAFRKAVQMLPVELARLLPDEDNGPEKGLDLCTDLQVEQAEILQTITACTSFEDWRSKVEMLHTVRTLGTQIVDERQRWLRQYGGGDITAEDEAAHDKSMARTKARSLEKTTADGKIAEYNVILQGEEALARSNKVFAGTEPMDGIKKAADQLEQLFEFQIARIRDLRAAYKLAEIPEDQWVCSVGPAKTRRERDVNYAKYDTFRRIYAERAGYGFAKGEYNDLKDKRRKKYALY